MKATGIVRRIDDLGRVVIPKEIRRTMRIREGDPLDNSLTLEEKFAIAVHSILKRYNKQARWNSPRLVTLNIIQTSLNLLFGQIIFCHQYLSW